MHILSISGFHFGLLETALKKMKLKKIAPFVLIVYGLFLNSIPGYRTIISLLYRVIGKIIRKDTNAVTGIFIGMFIQAFLNPYYIFKQGYLLTYLSTLGILLFYDRLLRFVYFLPKEIKNSIALTIAALSLSLPVILSFSPDFSVGVFLGNFILVPLYSVITYISFVAVIFSAVPIVHGILFPFIESIFLLSFYLGRFFSGFYSSINMESFTYVYVPILILMFLLIRCNRRKAAFLVMILVLGITLPMGTSISVYSTYGRPYIRIIHNFSKYDMMDYRVAEEGFIPIRTHKTLKLGQRTVQISPQQSKKGIPLILVDGNTLRLSENLPYYQGVKKHHHFFFWQDKVYKVY